MSSFTQRTTSRPVARFEGAKTTSPIPVRTRNVFDALIVASLDPDVRILAPAEPITISLGRNAVQHIPDFRLATDGRAIVVDICSPSRSDIGQPRHEAVAAALAEQGIAYEVREPPPVHGGPLLMNARSVWGCRLTPVMAADQVRILDVLRDGSASLAEVAQAVRTGDGIAAILGLACRDIIEIDLAAAPLGPETVVRRRRPLPSDATAMSTRGRP